MAPAPSSRAAPMQRPADRAQRVSQAAVEPPVTANRGSITLQSRNAVLHELQRQLKRVGCYKGRIGDDWGSATRPSMIAFLERVNATLPTTEPDEVLLTLVRAAPGQVCGSPCPRGQSMADGRCQPDALCHWHREPRVQCDQPVYPHLSRWPAPRQPRRPMARCAGLGPERTCRRSKMQPLEKTTG
jgi:hypothetical protein